MNLDYSGQYNGKGTLTAGTFQIIDCTSTSISISDDSALVPPGNSCNIVLKIGNGPENGEWFQLEIKPPVGAPTTIRKTIPTGYNGGKLV